MAVLKGQQANAHSPLIRNWDLPDLQREAEAIVESARAAASSILCQAKEEARGLRDQATREGSDLGRRQGHEEGVARGVQEGRSEAIKAAGSEIDSLMKSFSAALSSYEALRDEAIDQAQSACLDLSVEIARRVVHRICETDHTVARTQIIEAVSMVARPSEIEIAVNDADHACATSLASQLIDRFAQCRHVEIVPDPSVDRGGCLVRTAGGEIDARIQTQLSRIVESLIPDDSDAQGPTPWDSMA